MTRLTPTRTRPDIVTEAPNYTVVQSKRQGVTAMNLPPTRRDRNYFTVIPREEAGGPPTIPANERLALMSILSTDWPRQGGSRCEIQHKKYVNLFASVHDGNLN